MSAARFLDRPVCEPTAPVPGWRGCRVLPESQPARACLGLGVGVPVPVFLALVTLVLLVMPGQPRGDLREPGVERPRTRAGLTRRIGRYDPGLGDEAAVTVALGPLDPRILAECHADQAGLRLAAVRLTVLGSVDAREPYLVRDAVRVAHRQRVTVRNRDDMHVQDMRRRARCRRENAEGGEK